MVKSARPTSDLKTLRKIIKRHPCYTTLAICLVVMLVAGSYALALYRQASSPDYTVPVIVAGISAIVALFTPFWPPRRI
jgi:hypothetical protein